MIPKTLRQRINVYCHQKAQAEAAKWRQELISQAEALLKAGKSQIEIEKDLFSDSIKLK